MISLEELKDLATVVGTLLASIGIILVFLQLRAQSLIGCGDFLLRLDKRMGTHRDAYGKLMEEGDWYGTEALAGSDAVEVEYYMTFFHTLYQLTRESLISVADIDRMFGYRFLIAMHNPAVKKLLAGKPDYWEDLRPLYDAVLRRRKKKQSPIPRVEGCWASDFLRT